jgi:phytoene synthase
MTRSISAINKPAAVLRCATGWTWPMPAGPATRPADRAFAALIETYDMPRALPEALLEGLGLGRDGAPLCDALAICAPIPRASPRPSGR